MKLSEFVAGQRQKWQLVEKLGEGDAGEVYLVESLLERKDAILKRPYSGAFHSEMLRQATQIETEGKILKALEKIAISSRECQIHTPALLDQSPTGTENSDRFFIVIERASGFDLNWLARSAHFGRTQPDETGKFESAEQQRFLDRMIQHGELPELILLRSLAGVLQLLEKIHYTEVKLPGLRASGLIWNDVKPDHLFWDPIHARLTVIDWGNGQFLEDNGSTQDRLHSNIDDYLQFVQEMGRFLSETSPDLYKKLEWPSQVSSANAFSEGVKPIKEKIAERITEALGALEKAREREADLITTSLPEMAHLRDLVEIQKGIFNFGELPDYRGTARLHMRLASRLASEHKLDEFRQVCEKAHQLQIVTPEKCQVLDQIAEIATQEPAQDAFCRILAAGVHEDWSTALWDLLVITAKDPQDTWWEPVSRAVRQVALNLREEALTPYVAVTRLYYTLQETVRHELDGSSQEKSPLPEFSEHPVSLAPPSEALLQLMKEEVVIKWKEYEPGPPNSGIEYNDLDGLLSDIENLLPAARADLDQVLEQPKAQVSSIMEAWHNMDFERARRGLRQLLVLDPDRRRLLLADRAIQHAPRWLERVRQGDRPQEAFHDYLTQVEWTGRELRNQVGPAPWLDQVLDALKQLRSGTRSADLIMQQPELATVIPWLNEHRSRETISLPGERPLNLERELKSAVPVLTIQGIREAALGPKGEMQLAEPLDVWVPEARGSSARVFAGALHSRSGQPTPYAIKIMRPDRVEYSLPLFREEVQILTILKDVPGVTRLVECGYIHLDDGSQIPVDDRKHSASDLRGRVERYGLDEVQNFLISLDAKAGLGWLPYLALEKRDQDHNLMKYCDANYTHGRFLPLKESLLLAIQICDILQIVHDRNIVYRDHKILHYYWDAQVQGVLMIDWNIAKRHPQGLSSGEKQFDLVQFGARALHHILTGRAAPGALPLGPNRPEDIEQASHSYRVQWTYDDERLPNQIKDILEKALVEGYANVRDLRQELHQVYQQIPE